MTTMYVDAEALNLREQPNSDTDNRIGSLFLTQRVEILDSDAPEGWAKVSTNIEEKPRVGYVSIKYLRAPLSTNREALIASVNTEFMRFRRGLGKENVQPYAKYVGEMWKAIGNDNLDGTDTGVAWSAAAISFMVRNAGDAYKNFKFAAAHSKFVHHAIQAKKRRTSLPPSGGIGSTRCGRRLATS